MVKAMGPVMSPQSGRTPSRRRGLPGRRWSSRKWRGALHPGRSRRSRRRWPRPVRRLLTLFLRRPSAVAIGRAPRNSSRQRGAQDSCAVDRKPRPGSPRRRPGRRAPWQLRLARSRSAGWVHPMRSPGPWCSSHRTTAATSRERNCSWTAVSHRCTPSMAERHGTNSKHPRRRLAARRPVAAYGRTVQRCLLQALAGFGHPSVPAVQCVSWRSRKERLDSAHENGTDEVESFASG